MSVLCRQTIIIIDMWDINEQMDLWISLIVLFFVVEFPQVACRRSCEYDALNAAVEAEGLKKPGSCSNPTRNAQYSFDSLPLMLGWTWTGQGRDPTPTGHVKLKPTEKSSKVPL